MLFSGHYEHSIDAKNRLAVPSPVRATLEQMGLGKKLYIALGTEPHTLDLWPAEHFAAVGQQLPRGPLPDPRQRQFMRFFFSTTHEADIDSQGRILIPDSMMQLAGIGRQVYIIGVYDHLEIWNKDKYQKFIQDNWPQYALVQEQARQSMMNSGPTSPPAQRG